jgi:GNAT superfamily N-acetyltransferase
MNLPFQSQLKRELFTESMLPDVADFYCGDEFWEMEPAIWLKAPAHHDDCALSRMRSGNATVWLYRHPVSNEIIGFGSLGRTRWRFPGASGRAVINLIPHSAVAKEYWGEPSGPKEDRYASQIIGDIAEEAKAQSGCEPILGLFVQENNTRAIRFYLRTGFAFVPGFAWKCQVTGHVYPAMYVAL